jgi:hypothetical protein
MEQRYEGETLQSWSHAIPELAFGSVRRGVSTARRGSSTFNPAGSRPDNYRDGTGR